MEALQTHSRIRTFVPLLWSMTVIFWGLRRPLPPDPAAWSTGFAVLVENLFTLLLWGYLVWLGMALGRWSIRRLGLIEALANQVVVWATPTGLILIGYPVYVLGLLGFFRPNWIAILLVGLTLWLKREMWAAWHDLKQTIQHAVGHVRCAPRLAKSALALMGIAVAFSFTLALMPPTEYDALWYHLQGPRLFLEAGRIYPEQNNWPANYAFAHNMVYAIPLALGNDIVPNLLHWTFALALLGIVFCLAFPLAGSFAWIAPAFVLTMPSFLGRLAPSAVGDIAAGCLELMAFGGLLRAVEERHLRWLLASGCWAGLALASKFTSLPGVVVGVIFWLWRGQPADWGKRVKLLLLLFLLPAGFLAAPWYLKNAFWFGTPFFPAGLSSHNPEIMFRKSLLNDYTLLATYQGLERFLFLLYMITVPGSLVNVVVGPPLALPLLIFGFFSPLPFSQNALMMGILRMLLWTIGPPHVRFLISAFALMGVALATTAASQPSARFLWSFIARILVGSLFISLCVTVVTVSLDTIFLQPWGVILGTESRSAYLRRVLNNYRAAEYIRYHLNPNDRVLLIGDARHYYCPPQCYPEADHFTWPRLVWAEGESVEGVARRLERMGITHLWISQADIEWLLDHDPGGWVRRSHDFLITKFAPQCGQTIYADSDVEILRLTCLANNR